MEDLISVVVPVYNAEKYLKSCIESIINQTYTNLDIILVDDGSTDSSGKICDEYAENDRRINVIHKTNGGNGDARNAGLAQVKGQWIVCMDNDDVLHRRQVEILLRIAKDKAADIVVGGYRAIENDEIPIDDTISEEAIRNAELLNDKHLYDDEFIKKRTMILFTPWSKLYRKETFDNIKYPAKSKHDDAWTTWKIYENAKKVAFISEPLYYWRKNPDSFGRGTFDVSHFEGIDAYKEQLEYFYNIGKQRYVEIVFAEYTEMFFWCYNRMVENNIELELLMPYLEYMRSHLKYLKITHSLGVKQWVKYRYLAYYKIPKILNVN